MASEANRRPRKKGRKNRKHLRNREKCARYRACFSREKNKARRLACHVKAHPRDAIAAEALGALLRFLAARK